MKSPIAMPRRLFHIFLWQSLPIVLALVVFGSGAILITNRFLIRDRQEMAMRELEQIKAYYEVIVEEMDSLNLMFATNSEVMNRLNVLLEATTWPWQDAHDIRLIRSYTSALTNARPYIDSIYIYQDNPAHNVLTNDKGIVPLDQMEDWMWYTSYQTHGSEVEMWAESRQVEVIDAFRPILTIYRGIYNGSGHRIGVMVLNLEKEKLVHDFPGVSGLSAYSVQIADSAGIPLLTLGSVKPEDGPFVHFSLTSKRFGWVYDMAIPTGDLYHLSRLISWFTVALSLLALVFGCFLTYSTNRKERQFIQNTLDLLEQAEGSKIETEKDDGSNNLFDYMTSHILKTFLNQHYLKIQKEAMEYRALQMQINPHFVFNTLETINWRAIKLLGGSNDVSHMITLLSQVIAYAMTINTKPGVTLGEEIEETGYYIELQTIRFGNAFALDWHVDESLKSFHVPRLFLQPLLENCFSHGFKPDGSVLRILVEILHQGDFVCISVNDNGLGYADGQILPANDDRGEGSSHHIGLENVRKRMDLFFGRQVAMNLDSLAEGGLKVTFLLPFAIVTALGDVEPNS